LDGSQQRKAGLRPFHTAFFHNYTILAIPPQTGKVPNGALFQHQNKESSHIHLLWTGAVSVRSRACNAILKAIGIHDPERTAVVRSTIQTVKDLDRFLVYLWRGPDQLHLIGRMNVIQYWKDHTAPYLPMMKENDNGEDCCTSLNRKSNPNSALVGKPNATATSLDRHGDKHVSKLEHLRSILSTMWDYGKELPPSFSQLKMQLDDNQHEALVRLYGAYWEHHLRKETERQQVVFCQRVTSIPFKEFLLTGESSDDNEASEAIQFFNTWFQVHDIVPERFLATIYAVMDKKTKKRNTIVLRGGSNAGKSLIVKLLLGHYPVARLGRARDMDSFHWMPLLDKPACAYEEMRVYPSVVDEFKCVLGGMKFTFFS